MITYCVVPTEFTVALAKLLIVYHVFWPEAQNSSVVCTTPHSHKFNGRHHHRHRMHLFRFINVQLLIIRTCAFI